MKFVILTVLALAVSSEALYPLPQPIVPAVTYGVPEEHKPVVTVNNAIEVAPAAPIASVVTVQETKPVSTVSYDYSIVHPAPAPAVLNYAAAYPAPLPSTPIVHPQPFPTYGLPQQEVRPFSIQETKPVTAVSYDYSIVHPAPAPVVPASQILVSSPSELHIPSDTTSLVDGSFNYLPTLYNSYGNILNYGAAYSAPLPSTPIFHPQPFPSVVLPQPLSYYASPSYGYGYSGLLGHQLAYSAAGLVSSGLVSNGPASSVVTITGPTEAPVAAYEEHKEITHKPSVVSYEYQLPQVNVVHEIPKPVVPQTVYGVPH